MGFKDQKLSYYISLSLALFFAILTFLLGISALIGWHLNMSILFQYKQNTVPIVYNSALCFIALSLSVATLIFSYSRIVIVFITASLLLAIANMFEILLNTNLGINQLFFTYKNNISGEMAINTSLCFILSGVALLFMINKKVNIHLNTIGGGLALLVFCLSILFASGYYTNIQKAYLWGHAIPMSLNTAIGFILLSISIMSLCWYKSVSLKIPFGPLLPFIGFFSIIISFSLLSLEIYQEAYKFNLSSIFFITGIFVALLVGLILRFMQIANLSAQEAKYALSKVHAALESTADGIIVLNNKGQVLDFNKRFLSLWRQKELNLDELKTSSLLIKMGRDVTERKLLDLKLREILEKPEEDFSFEIKLKNKTYLVCYSKPLYVGKELIGRVWSFRDITIPKRLEEELSHQSTHDGLTKLPNRSLILDMLTYVTASAKKNRKVVGFFLLGLDRFSQINEVFGRSKGDELLQLIAQRLRESVSTDSIVGRVGGDEFVIISSHNNIDEIASNVTELMHELSKPFKFHKQQLNINSCVGVSVYPKDGTKAEELFIGADIALARAKIEGRNTFEFYSKEMNKYSLSHIALENQLRNALTNDEFTLYYQPILDLNTLKTEGFEVLIRWEHPQKGIILPGKFIPLAEEIGLINDIGLWTIKEVSDQLKKWKKRGVGTEIPIIMSINLSSQQFKSGRVLTRIKEISPESNQLHYFLQLELTESTLLEHSTDVIEALNSFKKKNIKVAIDDFGTGYSCLSYLKNFPVDIIKIDRAFVKGVAKNRANQALVKTIISLGKNLNMMLIAEGIENKADYLFLKNAGCEQGQGYYFAKPLPAALCDEFLLNSK